MTAQSLVFQSTQFNIVGRNNQPWLKGSEVAAALGYARPDALNKIYERNKDEFTESMVGHVKMTLPGNLETTARIFSLRGCHLLAMFARTKVAKEFRKWVLDILDKEVGAGAPTAKGALTPEEYAELLEKRGKIIVDRDDTAARLISLEQQDILFNLMAIRFPEGKDRPYGWSRFNRHFVISSYKHLQADRFAAACCYIPAMPDRQVKALPAPDLNALIPRLTWTQPDPIGGKDSIRNYAATEKLIMELKAWADSLPRDIGSPLRAALNDLENLLVTGWTEVDEALSCITQGMNYLSRWQGRDS